MLINPTITPTMVPTRAGVLRGREEPAALPLGGGVASGVGFEVKVGVELELRDRVAEIFGVIVEVGAEEERVLVVRITPGPRITVASELRESKLFCETATQVSPGMFCLHLSQIHPYT
jgi:hypothetical protein